MLARKSKIEAVTFGTAAPLLTAMGYAPSPCEWGEAAPRGAFCEYWKFHEANPSAHAHMGASVLLGARPADSGTSGEEARRTHCAALIVETHDKTLAKELEALVQSRLIYRDGVTGNSPVRVANGTLNSLRVFALADGVEPFAPRVTRPYYMPKDDPKSWSFKPHRVSILSASAQFVAIGNDARGESYEWVGGDLLTIPRSTLPVLTYEASCALAHAIDTLLAQRGKWWV